MYGGIHERQCEHKAVFRGVSGVDIYHGNNNIVTHSAIFGFSLQSKRMCVLNLSNAVLLTQL